MPYYLIYWPHAFVALHSRARDNAVRGGWLLASDTRDVYEYAPKVVNLRPAEIPPRLAFAEVDVVLDGGSAA